MKKIYYVFVGRSVRAVYIYRISSWFYKIKMKPIGSLFWSLNVALHSIEISPLAKIGKNFNISHTVGTVIGDGVLIGNGVEVYQNVTLGAKKTKVGSEYPRIGDNVTIYPGSIIIGGVNIGNDVVIGANSVVLSDVPSGCTVVGTPAKIISNNNVLRNG